MTLFVFSKIPPKHYKNGESSEIKNLDQFLTLNLDQWLTLKPPNLGPIFNFTVHIYIYMCAGELVSVPLFLLLESLKQYHVLTKFIYTAATSKSRVRNSTTGELETIPPQGSFFGPFGGTVSNS